MLSFIAMNAEDKKKLNKAVDAVRKRLPDAAPRVGIIFGSGWGEMAKDFPVKGRIPFSDIPFLGKAGVPGHVGELLLAEAEQKEVLIFHGRRHYYEGEGWVPVILPIWIMKQFGVKTVLLTNASGSLRQYLEPGKLVTITDHINFSTGNALIGAHDPDFGERFPDQTEVYTPALRQTLMQAGADSHGIYFMTSGPVFETPAEIRAYRALGADIVGMSTAPEAAFASALRMKVAGLSCVCNWAAGYGADKLTHGDIAKTAVKAMPHMRRVVKNFIKLVK